MVGGRRMSMTVAHMILSLSRLGASSFCLTLSKRSPTTIGNYSRLFLTGSLNAQTSCNYFLMKSEPDEFSIQDLEKCKEHEWDGIRSFQARNKLRAMKNGDLAFFYHSSCKVPGIVGTMRVVREAAPDATALDPDHTNYDPKSTSENCRWDSVRVGIESIFDTPVTLKQLRSLSTTDEVIGSMSLLRQSRLSVHDVTPEQWNRILELAANHSDHEEKVVLSEPVQVPKESKRTRKRKSSS